MPRLIASHLLFQPVLQDRRFAEGKAGILLVPLLLAGVLAQAAEVRILGGSARSAVFAIDRNGQSARANVLEMRVGIQAAPFTPDRQLVDILMLHDPQTGLFMWRYQSPDADHPGNMVQELQTDSAVFIQLGKLVEFRWIAPSLWVRKTAERHPTMADGLASVLGIIRANGIPTVDTPPYQEVNLASALDVHFLYKLGTDGMGVRPHLREVALGENRWKISLNGPNGDTASVLLSDKFEIIPAQ